MKNRNLMLPNQWFYNRTRSLGLWLSTMDVYMISTQCHCVWSEITEVEFDFYHCGESGWHHCTWLYKVYGWIIIGLTWSSDIIWLLHQSTYSNCSLDTVGYSHWHSVETGSRGLLHHTYNMVTYLWEKYGCYTMYTVWIHMTSSAQYGYRMPGTKIIIATQIDLFGIQGGCWWVGVYGDWTFHLVHK